MFLKRLQLKGFKSFADPVTLDFEPGITVIVGPNGSGKSNIVDAVAWVLGAQSPRSVRSSKMEDVIFAGTEKRSALGRAEVSLVVDNRSGRLPVDLPEVTITRTLWRSGESEYSLNGAPCRLLDIQEILYDTGVGRQQHVIISQGQLDSVLNAKPEERRLVIEEAAGVLKYRRRKERAERRLESTEENLQRVSDMVRESRRRLRPLERQAAAARTYEGLAAENLALQRYLAGQELARLEAARGEQEAELAARAAESEDLARRFADLDRSMGQIEAQLAFDHGDDLGELVRRAGALSERARGALAVLTERRLRLSAALDAAESEDLVSTLEHEAAGLAAELTEAAGERAALASEVAGVALEQAALSARQSELEEREAAAGDLRALEQAALRGQADEGSLAASVDRERHGELQLEERCQRLAERRGAIGAQSAAIEERVEELGALANEAREALSAAEGALEASKRALDRAAGERREADRHWHALAARAEALESALAEQSQAEGIALLTGEGGTPGEGQEDPSTGDGAKAGAAGVVGTLGALVDVDSGFAQAFESAVGLATAAVLVEDALAARRAFDVLAAHQASGSIVPLAALGAVAASRCGQHGPGDAAPSLHPGWLRQHVSPRSDIAREQASGVLALLDWLLGSAVVAQGIEEAFDLASSHPDWVVVTHSGERFAPEGWRPCAGSGVVSPASVAEARGAADAAATVASDAALRERRAAEEREEADRKARDARERGDLLAAEAREAASTLQQLRLQLDSLENEIAEAASQRDEIREALERDEEELAAIRARLPELEEEKARAAEMLEALVADRRSLEEARRELDARQREVEAAVAKVDERRALLARRKDVVEARLARYSMEREAARQRREQAADAVAAVERLIHVVEQLRPRIDARVRALSEDHARRLALRHDSDERLVAQRQERRELEAALAATQARRQQVELAATETRLRLEAVVEEIEGKLRCSTDEVIDLECPPIPEGMDPARRARDLAAELASLGPINPLAVEEHAAIQKEVEELEIQMADVTGARRELRQLIAGIEDEIAGTFAAAYADVDRHFANLMTTLFPGGTGRLVLTEPDRLLETGIEVEARLAGKGYRKLALLSGGERALVSLAFSFAVFRSRPAPFYMMDEVEAALDDVSLHRFLALIEEFRDEAQLLIVSHQKLTMEAADAIYGVTAAPGSSSKVLSERLRRSA